MGDLWTSFPIDPRDRANAALRASDEDRERITAELASAFASGKLDAEELEERTTAATTARTLGELPPIVADLVPLKPPPAQPSRSLVGVSSTELQRRAVEEWRDKRHSAILGFVGSGLLLWTIWGVAWLAGYHAFPWPAIVSAFALLNLVRVVSSREQIVRDEVRRLEKKQARQQRWPRGLP